MQIINEYKIIVDATVAEILSHKANGKLLNHKIILFIAHTSHHVSLPISAPKNRTHANTIKNISTNKINVDKGTMMILVIKNTVGNW